MRSIRIFALLAILVLAAQPLSACIICEWWTGQCQNHPAGPWRCQPLEDGCIDSAEECARFAPELLASQWTVASVEVTRPTESPRLSTDEVKIASSDPHTHSQENR